MDASRIQKHFVAVMAKHLPPSGSAMQLLNLDGQSGCILSETRADLRTLYITPNDLPQANIASDTIDAVIAYDVGLTESMLRCVLDFLRPGGRFIVVQPRGCVSESHALRLKGCGFVRILVEPALNELGVLIRGEKPHDTADTLERIRSVARADSDSLDLKGFKGTVCASADSATPQQACLEAGKRRKANLARHRHQT